MQSVNVFVGLDYHSDSIRVCVMTDEGEELLNRSVPNGVGHVVEAVQGCTDRGRKSEPVALLVKGVAIEACTGSAEFATRLGEATEWTIKLAHASAVHRLKQGPDKTDHGDAWHLANLIRVNYLPEVWLADETTRQLRHLVRYRQSLMADYAKLPLRQYVVDIPSFGKALPHEVRRQFGFQNMIGEEIANMVNSGKTAEQAADAAQERSVALLRGR